MLKFNKLGMDIKKAREKQKLNPNKIKKKKQK